MTKQSAQHSYPIIASGMVIVKDPLNNTKRIVKNININLEREDERSKKQRQKGISIQQ